MTDVQIENLKHFLTQVDQHCVQHAVLPWAVVLCPADETSEEPDHLIYLAQVGQLATATGLTIVVAQMLSHDEGLRLIEAGPPQNG